MTETVQSGETSVFAFCRPRGDCGDPLTQTNALHLALQHKGKLRVLRDGGAVAYASSVPLADGRQSARTLAEPSIARIGGRFMAVAVPLSADGLRPAGDDCVLIAESVDLTSFTSFKPVSLGTSVGVRSPRLGSCSAGHLVLTWEDDAGSTRSNSIHSRGGAWEAGQTIAKHLPLPAPITISEIEAKHLMARLTPIHNVCVEVTQPTNTTAEAIRRVPAILRYSDGSSRTSAVDWDEDSLSRLSSPGRHHVRGHVRVVNYPFPLVRYRADPFVFQHGPRWYLVGTDDTENRAESGVLIRAAGTITDLARATDVSILQAGAAGIEGCFWAPEVHHIGGAVRLLFAPSIGTPEWHGVQCHILSLRHGGDPLVPSHWSPPEPILHADGSPLQVSPTRPGISLDMTYFEAGSESYYAWSQRELAHNFIGDAELWIARVDPANPTRLTSDPVAIHTASMSWELTEANVVEGPCALIHEERIHLAYAAAAVGPHYTTGFLTAHIESDLLNPDSWSVQPFPALDSRSIPNQWGPGHVSFTKDGNETYVVFHAKDSPNTQGRHCGIRRVHWRADGTPDLSLTPERDVAVELRRIALEVVVA